MTMWYSLDKKNKVTRQGLIKVRISFSSEKNNQVAEQEHRHMLRIILLHELEMSQVNNYLDLLHLNIPFINYRWLHIGGVAHFHHKLHHFLRNTSPNQA